MTVKLVRKNIFLSLIFIDLSQEFEELIERKDKKDGKAESVIKPSKKIHK